MVSQNDLFVNKMNSEYIVVVPNLPFNECLMSWTKKIRIRIANQIIWAHWIFRFGQKYTAPNEMEFNEQVMQWKKMSFIHHFNMHVNVAFMKIISKGNEISLESIMMETTLKQMVIKHGTCIGKGVVWMYKGISIKYVSDEYTNSKFREECLESRKG